MKQPVRPKKALGQHFLTDQGVAQAIVAALRSRGPVLEVGPGTGVLTRYLLQDPALQLKVVEIDTESVRYLLEHYPRLAPNLYEADFLQMDLQRLFPEDGHFALIGNFPYNISSQIFFKVLDTRAGTKTYGILSVLLQAWYDIEYLFTVGEGALVPPPKVKSAVIRLTRNDRATLACDEDLFKKVVKTTFNQRRKTIRNSLKPILASLPTLPSYIPYLDARPEQLSVEEFVELTASLTVR